MAEMDNLVFRVMTLGIKEAVLHNFYRFSEFHVADECYL